MTRPLDKVDRPRCPVSIDLIDPDTFAEGLPLAQFAAAPLLDKLRWRHLCPDSGGDISWRVGTDTTSRCAVWPGDDRFAARRAA